MTSIGNTESSSPMVTRAVAAGLRNEFCDNYEFPGWQKVFLTGLGGLPQGMARFAISRFQSNSGQFPNVLDQFSMDELLQTRLDDYAQNTGTSPVMTVGGALAGATTYLSLALGGPFLPQAFVVTLKGGSTSGNVYEYPHRSLQSALQIAEGNPGLVTIQHFDPVHDGWLTRFVNLLRFKLLDLPPVYADFVKSRLEQGGAIVYIEEKASWLRYRVGPRSTFQVGGWDGIPAEEFLAGSAHLDDNAHRTGLKFTVWKLKDYPLEQGPESEWGSEPGLDEALETFCKIEGYRFIRIPLPHQDNCSQLAFAAAQKLLQIEGRPPAGTLVEMFSQFDSTAAMQSGLLPLWLVFNTEDNLEYLKKMSTQFPAVEPVFFSPLSTFSLTPDLVPYRQWEAALAHFQLINVGARTSHYPSDASALVKWAEPLQKWVHENRQPIHSHIIAEEIAILAELVRNS